jgi:hypothetical protein
MRQRLKTLAICAAAIVVVALWVVILGTIWQSA